MLTYVFLFYFCIISYVTSDEVPVALWNIKKNSMLRKPVSALGSNDNEFQDIMKGILKDDTTRVLVFAVNKLSLEDFLLNDAPVSTNSTLQNLETFLETHPHMFLPSVKDPLSHLHNMHCSVQEIIVDQVIDDTVLKNVGDAFDSACVVMLHVSDYSITRTKNPKAEELKKVFLPVFTKSSKNIVGLFTSVKSSWSNTLEDHHTFRRILSTSDPDPNFINITGCLIAYATNATLRIPKNNITTILSFPADTSGSKCGNVSSLLQLTFATSSEDITKVVVKFNFEKKPNSWLSEVTMEATGKKAPEDVVTLYSKDVTAATGFSFSCGKLDLDYKNKTATSVFLSFTKFQVEPFDVKEKFSDSFDCTPYFTIPIWMGVFVSLLFIAIINCGVYALFSVHTMDRFDDPKGKTISVAAAD